MTARAVAVLSIVSLLLACESPSADPDAGAPVADASDPIADAGTGTDAGAPPDDDAGSEPGADAGPDPVDPDAGPPPDDGRWGAPETTFTLPEIEDGEGYYYPDIQESFPEVDWDTVDRLYIPAGQYRSMRIGNLPDRDPSDPLIITNLGGQARVGGFGFHYLMSLGGGSNWVLTGRYDPISETGDAAFPGHRGGAYANSQGTYGIVVDDDFARDGGNSGIAVGGGATAFEIEHVEVCEVGFAGMLIKTDDDASAIMDGVVIHDTYVHDTMTEGFYIGSTQTQPQHVIAGLSFHHNRVLRTGSESIQIGQLLGDIELHNNVFGPSAIDWRATFQRYQDGNLQVSARGGTVEIHHNVFLGGAGNQNSLFGNDVEGDAHEAGDRVYLHDNYYAHHRAVASYANARMTPIAFRFEDNFFRGYRFDYDQVWDGAPPVSLMRVGSGDTVFEAVGNRFDVSELRFVEQLSDPDGNGTNGNVSGSGNVRGTVEPIAFRDAGLPADFDYLDLEMWAPVETLDGDEPIVYPHDTIVMHRGAPYRCADDPCGAGLVPPENADVWTALAPFPDDVRTATGSPYEGIGLDR